MKEVLSTISNLSFVIVGILALRFDIYAGLTIIGLGIASGGYHWTKEWGWQNADIIAINFVLLALINYQAGGQYWPLAFFIGGLLAIFHREWMHPWIVIGILGAIVLLIQAKQNGWASAPVIGWFALWIILNIPYLSGWDIPHFWIDLTHGASHIAAATGIHHILQ